MGIENDSGKITEIIGGCIWYVYKGDEITWTGTEYLSLLCEGYFKTLEEMDVFWADYFKAIGDDT
jgi:hypothetical protein